ncbi:FMN-dependent NADH-azoreductase [Suttonella ornithocola]|uniref:FMN dependent NADH:quinone oxidoreductase n=1 Tax=Suttonella ornithocola TaxID=279832 RepID=A0A380MZP7_9GAMM|nr:NAD(P)H-dependent oxidoreductase [Suttonella ornithocola]SUO97792.1 FMN-dependent NADH-azoreductase [Suttonella ornithocola]
MKTLLVLKTSVNGEQSHSNALLDQAVADARQRFPELTVIERDLNAQSVPTLNSETVAAIRAGVADTEAQKTAIALAETLVAELNQADAVLMGLPRYNFTAPASFKNYIDYIARPRITFRYGENGVEGLLPNIPVAAVITSGGAYQGTAADTMTPWVTQVLGFVGLSQVQFIHAENMAMNADVGLKQAQTQLQHWISQLS